MYVCNSKRRNEIEELTAVSLILTDKMLPTDVDWSRAGLETEGNRRRDLKST